MHLQLSRLCPGSIPPWMAHKAAALKLRWRCQQPGSYRHFRESYQSWSPGRHHRLRWPLQRRRLRCRQRRSTGLRYARASQRPSCCRHHCRPRNPKKLARCASLGLPAPSRAIASRHVNSRCRCTLRVPLPSSLLALSAALRPKVALLLLAAGRESHLLPCGLHGHLGHSRHQYLCSARLLAVPVQHLDLFHDPFLHHRHLLLRQLLPLLLLLRDRLYDRFRSCLPSQAIVESPAQQITLASPRRGADGRGYPRRPAVTSSYFGRGPSCQLPGHLAPADLVIQASSSACLWCAAG